MNNSEHIIHEIVLIINDVHTQLLKTEYLLDLLEQELAMDIHTSMELHEDGLQ